MSSSHKHGRERDGHHGSSSRARYFKDYQPMSSADHHSTTKKRIGSSSGSRNYVSSSDRYYEEKKLHGHTGSYYHPYSSSTASSSHRQQFTRNSGGGISYGNSGDHRYHGGGIRDSRKPLRVDYRKPYEKTSTSGSGIRRVPPPLSPPPPPLMKLPVPSSTSSRYRQAPPEDRHQGHRSSHNHKETSRPGSSHDSSSSAHKRERVEEERKSRKLVEKVKSRKRAAEHDVKSDSPEVESKKVKEAAVVDGEEIVEEEIAGDDEDESPEKDKVESGVKIEKSERKEYDEKDKDVKTLLKLVCTHCDVRCVTFKDFTHHLRSFQHVKCMTGFITDIKRKLYVLKKTARDQQKDLEKSLDGQKTLSDTSSYCRVCEIDLRTDPKEHEADNEIHNEIKAIIHRKCDICDVDFRFWKVYVYHTVALEHVKRVALLDLKEKEAKGENVKGTNLTLEDLGMDLLEEKNVFYCKACVRYFPIRDDIEETKMRHCMTLAHIKFVDEYKNRMKWLQKREELEAREKLEAEKKRERKLKEDEEKKREKEEEEAKLAKEKAAGGEVKVEADDQPSDDEKEEADENNGNEDDDEEEDEEPTPREPEDDQDDEDEIQLHAEADDSVEHVGDDDDEEDDDE